MNNNIKHKCYVCTSVCLYTKYLKKKERKKGEISEVFCYNFKSRKKLK